MRCCHTHITHTAPQVVNLADTANVMASPRLLDWAVANRLWSPATQGPLNWWAGVP